MIKRRVVIKIENENLMNKKEKREMKKEINSLGKKEKFSDFALNSFLSDKFINELNKLGINV